MAKALLIHPSYFRTYGSSEGGIAFPVYPILSLSAVGGALKARGHQITILDLSYREYDPKTIREQIVRERFDAVGITATTPLANQMRLILHTAAYWLMLTVRDAIPRPQVLANGEFSTIRLRLLKIAVRIKETASRIKLAFAANCPDAALFRGLLGALIPRPT